MPRDEAQADACVGGNLADAVNSPAFLRLLARTISCDSIGLRFSMRVIPFRTVFWLRDCVAKGYLGCLEDYVTRLCIRSISLFAISREICQMCVK